MNKTFLSLFALFAAFLLLAEVPAAASPPSATPSPAAGGADASAPEVSQPQARRFETADAAVLALIEAAAAEGSDLLFEVLGPELVELVSGDPVADANDRRWFVEKARVSAHLEEETPDTALLVIGPDDWPFPIPLAKDDQGWYFDTLAGLEELLNRRIGRNELFTLASMRAFVAAQRDYAAADPQGSGAPVYASRILSSKGQRDGLYWPTQAGEPESPLGPQIAAAVAEGYDPANPAREARPFHGYFYKILTAQGDQAPGGAMSYVKEGHLTQGFALLTWPASYGNSGIMTFQVNQRGLVYQKDLGEDTATEAAAIDRYNPGEGWQVVVD